MAKRSDRVLQDFEASGDSQMDAIDSIFAQSRRLSTYREAKRVESLALDRDVASMLGVAVEWSDEYQVWCREGQTPPPGSDPCPGSVFCVACDSDITVEVLSRFHLNTEHAPGSFLVGGTTAGGRRVFEEATCVEPSAIREAVCRAALKVCGLK